MRAKWAYVICLFLGGLMYLVLTPPGFGPDEAQHLTRAIQIGCTGLPARAEGGQIGCDEPAGAKRDMLRYAYGAGRPDAGVLLEDWKYYYATSARWDEQTFSRMQFARCQFVQYPPGPHLPQAIAAMLTRTVHGRTYDAVYGGRLLSLLMACLFLWCAFDLLEKQPRLQLVVFLLAGAPTALSLFASMSADGMTIATSILVVSVALYLQENWTERGFLWLLGSAVILSLCKNVYFLIPLSAVPVLWMRPEPLSRRLLRLLLLVTASVGPLCLWVLYIRHLAAMPAILIDKGVTPGGQLKALLAAPVAYLKSCAGYYLDRFAYTRRACLGYLGWSETELPWWLLDGYTLLLIAAGVAGVRGAASKYDWKQSLWRVALFVLTLMLIYTTLFVMSGREVITRVQGRYLVPILPLLFCSLPVLVHVPKRHAQGIAVALWAATTVYIGFYLQERYWGEGQLARGMYRLIREGEDVEVLSDGRRILFSPTPSQRSTRLRAEERHALFQYGIKDEAWMCDRPTDGVEFQIIGVSASGDRKLLWSRLLRPAEAPADRGVQNAALDVGDAMALEFDTLPYQTVDNDWSYWQGVRIR